MSGTLKIKTDIASAVGSCLDARDAIQTAKKEAKAIQRLLKQNKWVGSSAKRCADLLAITLAYHDDIQFLLESMAQHLEQLEKNFDEFPDVSQRMAELRNA